MELLEPPKGAHPCAGLTCAVQAPDIPALPHHPRVSFQTPIDGLVTLLKIRKYKLNKYMYSICWTQNLA